MKTIYIYIYIYEAQIRNFIFANEQSASSHPILFRMRALAKKISSVHYISPTLFNKTNFTLHNIGKVIHLLGIGVNARYRTWL